MYLLEMDPRTAGKVLGVFVFGMVGVVLFLKALAWGIGSREREEGAREEVVEPGVREAVTEGAWYYKEGGRRVGPVSLEELCAMFKGGALGGETMVWGEAFGRWVRASRIEGFRTILGVAGGPADEGPVGIGGLLIFPAIGRIQRPLIYGYVAWLAWEDRAGAEARGVWAPGSLRLVAMGLGALVLYEVVTSTIFFARRRAAVAMVVGSHLVWMLLLLGAMAKTGGLGRGGTTPLVLTAVWMWYFLRSRRVAGTFVR